MERNTLYRLDELAAMPITKAALEQERVEFRDSCERATAKGDKALALLRSAECNPRRGGFDPAKASDYEVHLKERQTK